MTVPTFESFMYPVLKNSTSEVRVTELAEVCAKELNLTEEDKQERTRKLRQVKYIDRTWWSVTYLSQAKILKRVRRGYYKITERGQELLNTGITKIDTNVLEQYKEYNDFKNRTSSTTRKSKEKDEDLTAEEKIQNSVNEIEELVKSEILERIQQQDPYFFETLVVDLLKSMGYAGTDNFAQSTKKSGDGGIDGLLNQDKLGLDVVYVQAKRYKEDNLVQGKEMRDFVGSLDVKGSGKGIFITTSDFASNALETIKSSSKKIITVNGIQLADLMLEHNVGVKDEKVLRLKRIDEDYFSE
jgi:restriction system protein